MSKTNPTKPTKPTKPRAGGLHGDVNVKLHSLKAQAIFKGREKQEGKEAIIGLLQFSGAANQVYKDAGADDPWADWWLLKIDEAIQAAEEQLNQFQTELKEKHPDSPNIEIGNVLCNEPLSKPFNFPNNFVYRMGFLIIHYDDFCCHVLGLKHYGLLKRTESERYLNLGGKPMRRALQTAASFRHQGVTRNDLMANNPKAQKARTLMGEVPQDIFEMKRRSEYAPDLTQYDSEVDDDVTDVDPTDSDTIKATG